MTDSSLKQGFQPTVEDYLSSEDETGSEYENDSDTGNCVSVFVGVANRDDRQNNWKSELPGQLVQTDTAQNAAASPLRDLEKNVAVAETFKPRDLTPEEEIEVLGFLEDWQDFNKATASDSLELFDLCLESENLVYDALSKLNVHQQGVFKANLTELGYDVQNRNFHLSQARSFGERLPEEYLCANISQEVREAVVAADFAPEILRNNFERLSDFDPKRREWDGRLRALQDKHRARQYQEASNLPGEQLRSLQVESPSKGAEISLVKPRPLPIPPSIRLPSPSEDLLDTKSDPINTPETDSQRSPSQRSSTFSPIQQRTKIVQLNNMAISTEVVLPLPVLPEGWTAEKDFKVIGSLSPATQRSIEPVGPHFLAHARRARHKRTFSEDDRIQAQENVKKVEDDDAGEISEPEDPSMLLRDAKDWKGQDHYAVLGLSKYRWKATEEQIKRAHRKKVLRHHPDKKAAAGSTEDDSFFKCIQKATEILLDPVKRRQFDSVDEAADVEPPTKKQTEKGNFYKPWNPVFKAEARFSRIQPVPKLGDENSSKEDVENFYNFWYNFDSWRSFEYQDEDVPDDNENRDQKRHMERKNANARRKKKTEDSARLRRLLDDCSALDPRIKKFRQEANASKNKRRLEKEAAEKKAAEEAKAKKEAEEKAAKEAEEAAKIEREAGKKAKEAAKNAVKKNKRVLKGSVKDANYFVKGDPPAAVIDAVLNDVELVQGKDDPDEIAALAGKLNGLKVADEIKAVWSDEVKRLIAAGKLKEGDAKNLV